MDLLLYSNNPQHHRLALILKQASTTLTRQQPLPISIVSIKDYRMDLEALVLGTLPEHALPFAMAPVLINLAKELVKRF